MEHDAGDAAGRGGRRGAGCDPHTYPSALADGADWYLHLRTCDVAGNCTSTVHAGPFWIDTAAPSGVGEVTSSSHSTPSNAVSLVTEWTAASDGLSGVAGYSVAVAASAVPELCSGALDEAAATATRGPSTRRWCRLWRRHCPTTCWSRRAATALLETTDCSGVAGTDVAVAVDSASYGGATTTLGVNGGLALGGGLYRVLACPALEDVAGNALDGDGDGTGGDAFARTFTVDRQPPTVSLVDSVEDTGDGQLAENEATNAAITELHVTFSEAMVEAVAESSSEWMLVGSGSGSFETVDCAGGVLGDDVAVAVDAITWDALSLTATLEVNGGAALADERYRLFACATLVDLGGNPLDGDGDGVGGDGFARTFLVDTVPPENPTAISIVRLTLIWAGLLRPGSPPNGAARATTSRVSLATRS